MTTATLRPAIDLADVVFRSGVEHGRATLPPWPMLPPAQVAAATAPPPPALPPPAAPQPAPTPAASPAAVPACPGYDHGPGAFPVGGTQVRLNRLNNTTF